MSIEWPRGIEDASPEDLDEIFDLLSSRRRRTILRILMEMEDDHVERVALAREVAQREARENAVGREMILVDLHHKQLPKLADAGIIEYHPQSGNVRHRGGDAMAEPGRDLSVSTFVSKS